MRDGHASFTQRAVRLEGQRRGQVTIATGTGEPVWAEPQHTQGCISGTDLRIGRNTAVGADITYYKLIYIPVCVHCGVLVFEEAVCEFVCVPVCVCVHVCACVCERRESDSLVVQHHVRQPDVFGRQPDLQHSIKVLRGPRQTIVLPLLHQSQHTQLTHGIPRTNHNSHNSHTESLGPITTQTA